MVESTGLEHIADHTGASFIVLRIIVDRVLFGLIFVAARHEAISQLKRKADCRASFQLSRH